MPTNDRGYNDNDDKSGRAMNQSQSLSPSVKSLMCLVMTIREVECLRNAKHMPVRDPSIHSGKSFWLQL